MKECPGGVRVEGAYHDALDEAWSEESEEGDDGDR